MMTHGSLFSGIGGFDLAAQSLGWQNVFAVENNQFCQQLLTYHFPQTKIYADIQKFCGRGYRGAVDVVSAGFPCQPFSRIGDRTGRNHNSYLIPEMLRVISEVQPKWWVGENVPGLLDIENGLVLEELLSGMGGSGYQAITLQIPAVAAGADHRRDRLWIVAYSTTAYPTGIGLEKSAAQNWCEKTQVLFGESNDIRIQREYHRRDVQRATECKSGSEFAEQDRSRKNGSDCVSNRYDGFSTGLDTRTFPSYTRPQWYNHAIKGLGNAIYPAVAKNIFRAIEHVMEHINIEEAVA